jgi:hypothetical protein
MALETERDARRAAHAIVPPGGGHIILGTSQCEQVLEQVCRDHGVPLGAYDQRMVKWLAGFGETAAGFVADLALRFRDAGHFDGWETGWTAATRPDTRPPREEGS